MRPGLSKLLSAVLAVIFLISVSAGYVSSVSATTADSDAQPPDSTTDQTSDSSGDSGISAGQLDFIKKLLKKVMTLF